MVLLSPYYHHRSGEFCAEAGSLTEPPLADTEAQQLTRVRTLVVPEGWGCSMRLVPRSAGEL